MPNTYHKIWRFRFFFVLLHPTKEIKMNFDSVNSDNKNKI